MPNTYQDDNFYYTLYKDNQYIAIDKRQTLYDKGRDATYFYAKDKQGKLNELKIDTDAPTVKQPEVRGRDTSSSWLLPAVLGTASVGLIVISAGILAPEVLATDAALGTAATGIEMSEIGGMGAVSPLAELGAEGTGIADTSTLVAEGSSITTTQALSAATASSGIGTGVSAGIIAGHLNKDSTQARDRDKQTKPDDTDTDDTVKPKYDGVAPDIPITKGKLVPGGALVEDGNGHFYIKDEDASTHMFYTPTGYSFHNNAGRKIMRNMKTGDEYDVTDKLYRMSYQVKYNQVQQVQQYDSDRLLQDVMKGNDRIIPDEPDEKPDEKPDEPQKPDEPEKPDEPDTDSDNKTDDEKPDEKSNSKTDEKSGDTNEKSDDNDTTPQDDIKPRPSPVNRRHPDRTVDVPVYHPALDNQPKNIFECPIIAVQLF